MADVQSRLRDLATEYTTRRLTVAEWLEVSRIYADAGDALQAVRARSMATIEMDREGYRRRQLASFAWGCWLPTVGLVRAVSQLINPDHTARRLALVSMAGLMMGSTLWVPAPPYSQRSIEEMGARWLVTLLLWHLTIGTGRAVAWAWRKCRR